MDNPLADQQREKKGAETFGKYDYQYHWAFKKLLDEHKQKKEYAIFIELHEDSNVTAGGVVIASDLGNFDGNVESKVNSMLESLDHVI